MPMFRTATTAMATAAMFTASGANAIDVTFGSTLLNVCVLSVTTPGVMAAATDGRSIGSEVSGGTSAVMTVVAVGLNPGLTFGAPTLQSPAGWTGTPTTALRYQSTGGVSQAYTSSSSTVSAPGLLDTYTMNARVENTTGFAGGTYTVRTTVTCQQ